MRPRPACESTRAHVLDALGRCTGCLLQIEIYRFADWRALWVETWHLIAFAIDFERRDNECGECGCHIVACDYCAQECCR